MVIKKRLGERKIVDLIIELQDKMKNNPVPFGDDVSAIRLDNRRLAVLKSDMLVGITDIPKGMSLWQASRKAVISSVSDLAAKGVQPKALLVSLGLPRGLSEKNIHDIGSGLNSGAREYGTYILGGDTNESSDFIIDVLAFGVCRDRDLVRRDTAKVGDIVAVTGAFGLTALGLKIIKERLKIPDKLKQKAISAVFKPKARLKEGLALAKEHLVTSSIDSSDGLAWSLHEIAKSSNVGFEVDNLPIHRSIVKNVLKNSLNLVDLALYGGEEYELLVTIKPALFDEAKKRVKSLIPIGHVTKTRNKIILRHEGKICNIKPQGFEHLRD